MAKRSGSVPDTSNNGAGQLGGLYLLVFVAIAAFGVGALSGDPSFESAAVKENFRKAEKGDVKAQIALGDIYYFGRGVSRDYPKALEWYRKAAEKGDAKAQHNVAVIYGRGEGVTKDEAEAIKWERRAANQGLADAQFVLGALSGENLIEAYKWLTLAIAGHNENAKKILAAFMSRMTPAQIAEGKKRAAAWRPSPDKA